MFMWSDFPSSFVGKRDMPDIASEEENMYYNANSLTGYCSGVLQMTNIYDTYKTLGQLWQEYMLGEWDDLLSSRHITHESDDFSDTIQITICANTLVYDGAQLIFAYTTSTLQGFSALTWIFNNFLSLLLGDI